MLYILVLRGEVVMSYVEVEAREPQDILGYFKLEVWQKAPWPRLSSAAQEAIRTYFNDQQLKMVAGYLALASDTASNTSLQGVFPYYEEEWFETAETYSSTDTDSIPTGAPTILAE